MIFPSKILSVNINNICFHFQSRNLVQTSHLLPSSQKMRPCFHTPGTNLAKTSKLFASNMHTQNVRLSNVQYLFKHLLYIFLIYNNTN